MTNTTGEGDELSLYEIQILDELEALTDAAINSRWRPEDVELEASMPPELANKFYAVAQRQEALEKELYRRYTTTGNFWIGVDLTINVARRRASLTVIHSRDYTHEFYANPL